jgi:hypothetical protein
MVEVAKSTLGKSGKRAPHGSFILCACFFGQSAAISYSQSMTLPLRPPSSISRCTELRHTAIERTMCYTREHSDEKHPLRIGSLVCEYGQWVDKPEKP